MVPLALSLLLTSPAPAACAQARDFLAYPLSGVCQHVTTRDGFWLAGPVFTDTRGTLCRYTWASMLAWVEPERDLLAAAVNGGQLQCASGSNSSYNESSLVGVCDGLTGQCPTPLVSGCPTCTTRNGQLVGQLSGSYPMEEGINVGIQLSASASRTLSFAPEGRSLVQIDLAPLGWVPDGAQVWVTAARSPDLKVGPSSGSGFAAPSIVGAGFCGPNKQCVMGDVTGDRKADLVAFDWTQGDVIVSTGDGATFAPPTLWRAGACLNTHCHLADANGDGRDDLLVFEKQGAARVWIYPSDGDGFDGSHGGVWRSQFCTGLQQCTAADVDGDRKADLIAFDKEDIGDVWVAISSGRDFGASAKWQDWACVHSQQCEMGDANGDGKADVIILDRSQVWVAISSGGSFYGPNPQGNLWSTGFCEVQGVCDVADVDGDGRADLVAHNREEATLRVVRSNGVNYSAASELWLTSLYAYQLWLGDATGDGRADLLLLGSRR
jgi:hypothetical protein